MPDTRTQEPQLPTCHRCCSTTGPWAPTGDRYPSGTQVLACRTCR